MLITIIKPTSTTTTTTNYRAPLSNNTLKVLGNFKLQGDASLREIQFSRDNGYSFEKMPIDSTLKGEFLLKSELPRMKGYSLEGNYSLLGKVTDFNVDFRGAVDCSNLILNTAEVSNKFADSKILFSPIIEDHPYYFDYTFYNCVELEYLNLTKMSEESLRNSTFNDFLPESVDVIFSESIDKELINEILKHRHSL